jgi:hypothetical protein
MGPRFANSGKTLVAFAFENQKLFLDCIDLESGLRTMHARTDFARSSAIVSPDGRTLLVAPEESRTTTFWEDIAKRVGLRWPVRMPTANPFGISDIQLHAKFIDIESHRELADDWGERDIRWCGCAPEAPSPFEWLPNQRSVAVRDPDDASLWRVWNLPPRKPLPWFFGGAALFASPIALVVRWRVRKLRAA